MYTLLRVLFYVIDIFTKCDIHAIVRGHCCPGTLSDSAQEVPRVSDRTGLLAVVRLGCFKGMTAVFGQDSGPDRVRSPTRYQRDAVQGTAGDR